jgi:RHS repeat-associated protein
LREEEHEGLVMANSGSFTGRARVASANFRTNNALIQTFNVNNLNELTIATNQGTLTVAGTTTIPATSVTVNGLTANRYADGTFALGGFTPTNGVNIYAAIGEDSSLNFSTNSITVNLLGTNTYGYDLNGNLTNDGYRNFAYDDENELIAAWLTNVWSNSFAYDGKMRRRIERNYAYLPSSNSYLLTNEVHFIYDGSVVIEERNAGNVPMVSYSRGLDLSGSLQGAGGIGGLLARTTFGQEIPGAPTTAFYHADGNGNVTALIFPNQQLAAKYLYDPFGNTLAMSGPLMNFNKYRFSSKYWNDNSALYYYERRFYDPNLGRWLNRDPIQERGGLNLYALVRNEEINQFDPFGLTTGVTTWNARPCHGTTIKYIQVVIGGNLYDEGIGLTFGGFPRVDSGRFSSTPYYRDTLPLLGPPGESSALFNDKPRAFSTCLHFEVCRVCVQDGQIVHVGPCKRWHIMTTNQNLNDPAYPTYPFPSFIFIDTVNKEFPNVLPPVYSDWIPTAG